MTLLKEVFGVKEAPEAGVPASGHRHYYIGLNHGAILVLANSAEEALQKAGPNEEDEHLEAVPLPEIAVVDNDNGFEWREV